MAEHVPNPPLAKAVARPSEQGGPPMSAEEQAVTGFDARNPVHWLIAGSAGWLVSLCLHFVLILLLALWYIPSLPTLDLQELIASSDTEEAEDLDDVPLISFDELEEEVEFEQVEFTNDAELIAEAITQPFEPAPASFVELSDFGLTSAISADAAEGIGTIGDSAYGRSTASRRQMVRIKGGSDASEKAVAMALAWLARHQNPDGTWSTIHTAGPCNGRCNDPGNTQDPTKTLRSGTALALLPFLGAGQTHVSGKHKDVVARGLTALVALGKRKKEVPGADWSDSIFQASYSHAISTLVMAEALGITGDFNLQAPAQAGIDFISYSQGPRGGWWYTPKRPGDLSVTGWQLQALKSGYIANLRVPPAVAQRGFAYLDTVSHDDGARYAYKAGGGESRPKPSMDAVGLLCRMYLGWKQDNESLKKGVELLAERGPSEKDYYYNYYAAQVLFQYTSGEGPLWREWNEKLRDMLIAAQDVNGHQRGSWFTNGGYGNYGGRLYVTSLATMTLEVYYRYLPIYKLNTKSVEFPE